MKLKVVVFAVSVFIILETTMSFAIEINNCGYLTQSNTIYVLQNEVNSEGSCFFITAENVTLDLNGHTVTYDNAAPVSVTNGDFETSGGWDLSAAPNAAIVAGTYVKPVTLYSGSQSLRISVPNADQSIRSTSPLLLQPNTTYSLSAMFYNQSNDPVTMYVELIGTATRASKTGKTWRGFQYVSVSFTTGANPDPVTVVAGISGGGTGGAGFVYFDDIRIQRTHVAGVAVGPAAWQGQSVISDVTQFGNANNATIRNGTIQQGLSKSDYSNAITVMENSGIGWKLHDLTLRADGANSKTIYSKNARDVEVYNNHIYNPQRAISSRDAFDGATVKVEYSGYGNRIYNNTVHEGVQTAFYLSQTAGQTPNEVSGNTIELQTRHTNDFAILSGGSKVYGNTINCGSGNNSCRGISTGGTNTVVYNNIVNVQQLPRNQEYNGCAMGGAYGMQMESNTTGLQVYGNTVTANAGECEAHAFRANPYAEGGTGSYNNSVHDNIFIAVASDTARASTIKYSKVVATDINVYNNIFRTNRRWIYLDGGGAVVNPTFTDNRWETAGTLPSPFYPFEVYTWADSHFTGTFNGNTYGTDDKTRFESEFFRTQGAMTPDPLSNYFISWHLTLNTINQSGQLLSDVPVQINDVNDMQVFSGSTDIQGKLTISLPDFKNVAGTKTFYNPFTITATRINQTFTQTVTMDSPRSISFTFDTTPPQINATPAGGTFGTPQSVTLSSTEPATIYYTLDGTEPTSASTVYSGAIAISSTKTLKFFGRDSAGNDSAVQSINYVIDQVSPVVTASPNGGTFKSQANVTLSANEPATIYYTTDGTEPTVNSNVYTQALPISTNTTIKFMGKDVVGNISAVQTAIFEIDLTPPTVTAFTIPSITNSFTVPITSFDANDTGKAVTGYCLTTGTTSAGCTWETTKPTSYSVSADGSYTLYPWAKDVAGNISLLFGTPRGVDVDTAKPTVTAFTIPTFSSYLTVSISAFTASDIGSHVTGYLVTDNSDSPTANGAGWSELVPENFKFTTAGKKILYAWAKDAAGNVSASMNSSVTIDLTTPVIAASGDLNGDGLVDIRDALLALKIAVGLIPSADYMNVGDVAPLINGKPTPDGKIDIGDAALILQKAINLVNW